ncbi:MAG: DNA-processing protein DprA, partial [Candidatus Harrisonbacteria bacterium]|nr:DNA-processing protein DprA [Candidatus Harrisonbacteria bacterium]
FAHVLAAKGVCIVSGLALGIDGAAHRGALRAGGITVGVLACGLDRVYPSEHTGLAKEMLGNRGALMSEYPVGSVTLPYRFLERNRIVSGLSKGIVVIEAPEQSGAALVTSPEDVLRAYGIAGDANAKQHTAALAALGAEERRIYDTLKENGEPLSVDKLSERVTLPIHIVTRALTFLQLKGFVRESSGAYEIS